MKNKNKRRSNQADVNLTPMLDVVFILLIFFIVTATFADEQAIGIEPPPPPGFQPDHPIRPAMLIWVNSDNVISVNNRITDISNVRANIERTRAETPEIQIIIQAHPRARSGTIISLRDVAYSAGFTTGVNVILSEAG